MEEGNKKFKFSFKETQKIQISVVNCSKLLELLE